MSDQDSTQIAPTVYFVRFGKTGPIKIGQTARPIKERLSGLQCGSPKQLYLCGVIENPRKEHQEKALHRLFKKFRFFHEWFHPDIELLHFIKVHAKKIRIPILKNPYEDSRIIVNEADFDVRIVRGGRILSIFLDDDDELQDVVYDIDDIFPLCED